jgi:PadR family transcriptional regulator, regulatory protein AphA
MHGRRKGYIDFLPFSVNLIYSLCEYIRKGEITFHGDTGMSSNDLAPEFALMGFLYFQPQHGYDLHRRLQTNLGEIWHISQSQVYNILRRLDKQQLIEAVHQTQEKRPDRDCFSLTPAGHERFEAWLYAPTRGTVRAVRVEFLTRLFFAGQVSPDTVSRLLGEQAGATSQDVRTLRLRLSNLPPGQVINRLGLDLRVRQLGVFLEWLSTCEHQLIP